MSVRLTLTCDGHRHGQPCRGARNTSYAYAPQLRSDDPARTFTPDTTGWRIGEGPNGGDLCPSRGHDEEP
jgi:hypothetical protein